MENLQNVIQERFLAEVKRLNFRFPGAKISADTGYKTPIVSEYLSSKKIVSEKFLQRFCEVYKIDFEALTKPPEAIPPATKPNRRIPIVGDAVAGVDMEMNVADSSHEMEYIDVGDLLRDADAAFTVYGNSMSPNYPSGCILGIKRNYDSFIQPGEIYMLVTRSNRVFKRLYYNKDKSAFYCHSDNSMVHEKGELKDTPYYPPFEIPMKDIVGIYDVVGMIKRTRNSNVILRQV